MEAVVTLNENSPGVKYLCAKDNRITDLRMHLMYLLG